MTKYSKLKRLSTEDLYRLFDKDRPSSDIRKTPLADLVGMPIPVELAGWGAMRTSQAMLEAARVVGRPMEAPDARRRLDATIGLLEGICDAQPILLRPVVLPAVRALHRAREAKDDAIADRLESLLLRLCGEAPGTVVGGVLLAANPRYPRKGRSKRWKKAYMVRAIQRGTDDLQNKFIAPVRQRLAGEGYRPMADRLDSIGRALATVISAAS